MAHLVVVDGRLLRTNAGPVREISCKRGALRMSRPVGVGVKSRTASAENVGSAQHHFIPSRLIDHPDVVGDPLLRGLLNPGVLVGGFGGAAAVRAAGGLGGGLAPRGLRGLIALLGLVGRLFRRCAAIGVGCRLIGEGNLGLCSLIGVPGGRLPVPGVRPRGRRRAGPRIRPRRLLSSGATRRRAPPSRARPPGCRARPRSGRLRPRRACGCGPRPRPGRPR